MSRILLISTVLITFIVYLLTMMPGLGYTDSGELIAVIASLGVSHPSGYPLFTLLGHLWSKLPFGGDLPYLMNMLSALFVALSCGVFFEILRLLVSKFISPKDDFYSLLPVFTTSLAFGFGNVVWQQAVAIEVYSLHLLLLLFSSLFFIKANILGEDKRNYIIAGLFLGLALSNHLTSVLLIPALLFMYFFHSKEKIGFQKERLKLFPYIIVASLVCLSLYLYLPIRSAMTPEFNWGEVSRSWDKFYYHASGKQYRIWLFSGDGTFKQNFALFFSTLHLSTGVIGSILAVWGILKGWNRYRSVILFFGIFAVSTVLYSFNYSIHDIDNYFLPIYASIFIFAGLGLASLLQKNVNLGLLSIAFPLIMLIFNYVDLDNSDNYAIEEYNKIMCDGIEEDAVVLSAQWDYWCSAFWYKQRIENYRPDIIMIEKEILRRTWYPPQLMRWYPAIEQKCKPEIDSFLEQLELFESGKQYDAMQIQSRFERMLTAFVEKYIDERPIYITTDIVQTERWLTDKYKLIPSGLALRVYRKEDANIHKPMANIGIKKFAKSVRKGRNYLEKGIAETLNAALLNNAQFAIFQNNSSDAKLFLNSVLAIDPNNRYAIDALEGLK